MEFPETNYDPSTHALLKRAFEEAWSDMQAMLITEPLDPTPIREALANRIITAANAGERDLKRLKLIAVGAID